MRDFTRNCFAKISPVLMVVAVYFLSLNFSDLNFQSIFFDQNICKSHDDIPGNLPANELDCRNHCYLVQIDEYEFKYFSLETLNNKFVFKKENVSYHFKIPSIEPNFNSPPYLT